MPNEDGHLYVVVREDLSSAQQAVQSAHACIEVARNTQIDKHPNLVMLTIKDEHKLQKFSDDLGIPVQEFREPDIGNQLTAIAAGPLFGEDRRKFRKLRLLK
jgi:hypothetical protein